MSKKRKLILLVVGILVACLLAAYRIDQLGWFHGNAYYAAAARVLVLEDCDRDFRTPPFEDAVITFAKGRPVRKLTGLSIAETVGACRSLSVAGNGHFLTVCENVAHTLTAYELNTGQPLWSVKGDFTSAISARNGIVYALASDGTIYGKEILAIGQDGRVLKQAAVGGFDVALDEDRNALWLVGKDIKRCDLEFKVLQQLKPIGWCAVSVAVNRDGSVWLAERQHPDVARSTNRIFKVSPAGQVLKSVGLPFSPTCLRVNRSDGTVWVTGGEAHKSVGQRVLDATEKRTGRLPLGKKVREFLTRYRVSSKTRAYSENGALQFELRHGAFSLELDPADGSVWLGGNQNIYHYSGQGTLIGKYNGLAADQKYIALLPAPNQP